MDSNFDLRARTILLTVGGSRAYGIHRADSDVDIKGVGVATAPYYHGFMRKWEQAEGSHMKVFADLLNAEETTAMTTTKLEGTVYDVRKFISLAVDANPNILDVLFCRDDEVRLASPLGRLLRVHRDKFISAKAKHTFSGYAASQLNRIRGHRAWLIHPPTEAPTRARFGLPENTLIPADQLAAAQAAVQKKLDSWNFDFAGLPDAEVIHITTQVKTYLTEVCAYLGYPNTDEARWLAASRSIGLDANLIYVMQKEREYEASARHWKQFQEWKRNRNVARAELEAKHGYDTKHAGHLFRLLRMGREILTTGVVHVWRGPGGPDDAEEIRAIRNGAWSYDELIEWAEREDAELEAIYVERRYVVPKQPDREGTDLLCSEIVETMLSEDGLRRVGLLRATLCGICQSASNGEPRRDGFYCFDHGFTGPSHARASTDLSRRTS